MSCICSPWATFITAVVGVVGVGRSIFAAYLTARTQQANLRLTISVEDRRLIRAEKRAAYAAFNQAVLDVIKRSVIARSRMCQDGNIELDQPWRR